VVADQVNSLLERRQIVAAVVDEWRRVLKHDLVIVREAIGPEQVALSNLDPIDAKLARSHIQQPLAHEYPMLPPRAAHRRHDGLVREDGGELALVVRNVVRPEQRALTVNGNR